MESGREINLPRKTAARLRVAVAPAGRVPLLRGQEAVHLRVPRLGAGQLLGLPLGGGPHAGVGLRGVQVRLYLRQIGGQNAGLVLVRDEARLLDWALALGAHGLDNLDGVGVLCLVQISLCVQTLLRGGESARRLLAGASLLHVVVDVAN